MKNIGCLFLVFLLFSSCQSNSPEASFQASVDRKQAAGFSGKEQSTSLQFKSEDRKIIKTAELRFQVSNLGESTKKIEQITKEYGGFVSGMNQTNSSYSINNYLTIRVPAEQLDQLLSKVEQESIYTDYTRIRSEDVTEEYLDINTRLATKKEVRDRYIEILRNKAQTVRDILEAEEKIRILQEEIEVVEGRLKFLNNRTSLSTVNIDIYQKISTPRNNKVSFFSQLKESFVNGWVLIQHMIIGLIGIWPIVLIIVLLVVWRKRLLNWRRK